MAPSRTLAASSPLNQNRITRTDPVRGLDEDTVPQAIDPLFTTAPISQGSGLFVEVSGNRLRNYRSLLLPRMEPA